MSVGRAVDAAEAAAPVTAKAEYPESTSDKQAYPRNYTIIVEQEPGSGGKESAGRAPKREATLRRGAAFVARRADDCVLLRTRPARGLLTVQGALAGALHCAPKSRIGA